MSIPNFHSTHHFGDASASFGGHLSHTTAAGMSPATAAADLAILGVSTFTVHDNVHFLATVMALMLRKPPYHLGNVIQAPKQNSFANCGKHDWPDTF